MRRRLINSTLAVVLVVIAVFGVSLVIVETRTITNSAQESVDSEALRLAGIVEANVLEKEPVDPDALAEQLAAGRSARILLPGRAPLAIGPHIGGSVIRGSAEGSAASWSSSRSPGTPSPRRSAAPSRWSARWPCSRSWPPYSSPYARPTA